MTDLELIPRASLLDHSGRSTPCLSPCGAQIAFVADHKGAHNLWIAPVDDMAAARPVTHHTSSGIREYRWSYVDGVLILTMDQTGNEKTQICSFDVNSGEMRNLSPVEGEETRLVAWSNIMPEEILVETNARDPSYFDLYRVNLLTAESELVETNRRFTWFYADRFLQPRLAEEATEDGGIMYHTRNNGDPWRPLFRVDQEDEALTRPFRIFELADTFGPDATEIYAMDSRGRDTAALAVWRLESGEIRILDADERCDICAAIIDPVSYAPVASVSNYLRTQIHPLDDEFAADLARIPGQNDTQLSIESQSLNGRRWIVARAAPDAATHYALFDRDSGKTSNLYSARPDFDSKSKNTRLAKMFSQVIKSRDGLDLVTYITLPPCADENGLNFHGNRLPMVVLVHGGPWIRDNFAFDPWIQILANRGYAVLTVNYRGSRGFGKKFLNAGDREWGGKIYDDVVDAVGWAVETGIADPARIALMGASFGGYTTLVGLTRTPGLYTCGIDIFGVSNLETFLQTIPPHWKALKRMWADRVGDIETAEGRKLLQDRSPVHHVNRIEKPLLIVQGGNDPRVVQAESDQIVEALAARDLEVTYALFPDEGHGFQQMANQLSFFAIVEVFLAKHLGGRLEPIAQAIADSSLLVPTGSSHLPELEAALTDAGRIASNTFANKS